MPPVSEAQRRWAFANKDKDKGLIVIGQDCWEDDDRLVGPFVKGMGEKMSMMPGEPHNGKPGQSHRTIRIVGLGMRWVAAMHAIGPGTSSPAPASQ